MQARTASEFFKVVQHRDNELVSCCLNPNFPEEYRVQYKFNEWVRPILPSSKLFVFKGIEAVQNFLAEMWYDCLEAFPCEVENPQEVDIISKVKDIEEFWCVGNDAYDFMKMESPIGTYWCDAVKLLRPQTAVSLSE